MGNTSSMLTQYDIEEVQEHCKHACKNKNAKHHFCCVFFPLKKKMILVLQLFLCVNAHVVTQQEIVSLYKRFCQLDRNNCGFIPSDEFLSIPEFSLNPLSQVLLSLSTHRFLISYGVQRACWIILYGRAWWGCWTGWTSRNLWHSCLLLVLVPLCNTKLNVISNFFFLSKIDLLAA